MKRLLVLGLLAGCGSKAVPPPPAPVVKPPSGDDAKFEGTITGGQFNCASDGRCEIVVDGKKTVEIDPGHIIEGERKPRGQAWDLRGYMYGDRKDFVGKQVEVYARDDGPYTLNGKAEYYVRWKQPAWPVPPGWKREQIMFPLEFAPTIKHDGMEELRFPPGFMKPGSPEAWAYTFTWALGDDGVLTAPELAAELTAYFRGLMSSVDGDKKRIDVSKITVTVKKSRDRFTVTARVLDAFHDGEAVELTGWAKREKCPEALPDAALWVFALAPKNSPARAAVDELAAQARCAE